MHKTPPCPKWLLGPLIATCCATALAQSDDTSNTLKIGYAAINFHAWTQSLGTHIFILGQQRISLMTNAIVFLRTKK
jgi:hypothetical protein